MTGENVNRELSLSSGGEKWREQWPRKSRQKTKQKLKTHERGSEHERRTHYSSQLKCDGISGGTAATYEGNKLGK